MVKLGTLISAFVVLTLLILLAPVAILGPPQNVVAQPEAVTEEIEASFSFTVTSGGAWHDFTAGSNFVQAGYSGIPRLALVQYTRQNVVINGTDANVTNCSFREYTTGSGTVTSTVGDLNGTLTLEWITVNFNMTYPHTPTYDTTDYFGWMMVRGHFIDGADSFAFVWVADFDSDDIVPTNFVGKGFMQSVEENGRFGNMSDPIDQRHKIMGDLDIVLSGGTYTGTFHLRNYPPNEVDYVGMINITGGVMQEFTDDISAESLEIMNVTSDGPMFTPADEEYPTGFEEIDWGKDPPKYIVDSDRLGPNGTMDLTRNSIMYLNMSVNQSTSNTCITIQVNPVCVLYIDDTNTGPRAGDGSPYGELYEILVLSLPQQYLPIGEFFDQTGYTYCPFGTVNGQPTAQTGLYLGAESFADAVIYIESSVGNSLQHSHDWSYGLYAHPKVSPNSIVPDKGAPNETLEVNITGKYFLRATNKAPNGTPIPNSGSVSFGDNITVNSYIIGNSNPVNNWILANITIDADATPGTRNVSVTSCFGYGNGNGAAPYKTGTKVDGFTIEEAGASLNGHVGLSGFAATNVTVRLFVNGTTTEAAKAYGATDGSGDFTIGGLPNGTYDIAVKGQTSLSNLLYGVNLSVAGTKDFGVLREGDAGSSNDDYIDGSDYGPLSNAWNSYPGITPPPAWDPNVDFSRDGYIDGSDYGPLSSGWNDWGDVFGWPGNWN